MTLPLPGTPEPIPAQRRASRTEQIPVPARPATNDLDLIASVIALAQDPGYVLIGPAETVWRCRVLAAEDIERVPAYEDAAVHQLLDQKLLRVEGTKTMRHGSHQGRARVVTVPKTTAAMAGRWRGYKPAR